MRHSQFVNPHGLTEEGQYSTARDMAKLAFVAYADPTIRAAVAVKELDFKHEGWTQKLKNTNRLLHGLSFVNGMKTGYTDAAGRCLICRGQCGDREAIAVVLGSNSQSIWNDAESLLRWALEVPETWEETSDAEEDEGEADE
jgi:D-alanyl-D-alanine carboxypeptidase (penicillin-binding protein 5/6)